MHRFIPLLISFLALCVTIAANDARDFNIRGTLPWHNFLSGPTAWDEEDYIQYLDRLHALGINYLAFHCYTGGAERYAPYVEPLIRLEYRGVVPEASLDTSLTARWGYRPLKVKDFAFNTGQLFKLPPGAEAFGARCAILARNKQEHYDRTQALMRTVIKEAHARGIQVALGFEFGIHPPEFASIMPPGSWIRGAMLPDPTHPACLEILYNTLDDILRAYPDLDWIWLWLHEHTMYVGKAAPIGNFRKLLEDSRAYFPESGTEDILFTGTWSLAYIQAAHDYLARRSPKTQMAISGWGGGTQLPGILRGLNQALPKDIVFTCLSPGQGWTPQLPGLSEIAKNRRAWAIPWLEGDDRLWHLQPRVSLLRNQVKLAQEQQLDGVLAIHWRTEEMRLNLQAFANFARNPASGASVEEIYQQDCAQQFGQGAAAAVAPILIRLDKTQSLDAASPEYFPYDPSWGKLRPELRGQLVKDTELLRNLRGQATEKKHQSNLDWLAANFEFTLLLDEVSQNLEPAHQLKEDWLRGGIEAAKSTARFENARASLNAAPMEALFKTYARRVRSKGELGELSSLNQRVWLQYQELRKFVDAHP